MLKKFFKSFKYGKKGFTLIELLVVVAILGVLAAVAIPNISKFIKSGTVSAANTELATVQTAAVAYATDHPGGADFESSALYGGTTATNYLDKPPKGTYHFMGDGSLDTTVVPPSYPYGGTTTLTFDETSPTSATYLQFK